MGKKQDNKAQQLEEKVAQLEKQIVEYDKQLKRAVADYRNLESRVSQDRSELTSFMGAELLRRLLPVLDHLEQALRGVSEEEKQSGWVKGVELAVKEFNQVLVSEGLDEIAVEGQFDPSLHEAVDTIEGDDNKILRVARRGYKLNNRVLRPAQVIVGKKNPPSMEETKDIPGGETQSDFHIPPREGDN